MKTDIKSTLNKLIAYARDNLLLDALDETYTLNRLAALCGVTPAPAEVEYDGTLEELLAELSAAAPNVDRAELADILLPLPHTVNDYFRDELSRKPKKAFDFLFELYALAGSVGAESGDFAEGFVGYAAKTAYSADPVALSVGDAELEYIPHTVKNHIAALATFDILAEDITAREAAFVTSYGGFIARRPSADEYLCCDVAALGAAKHSALVADGTVKTALLDYPVPAIAVYGIAKNAVARETARIMNAAAEKDIDYTVACQAKDGVTFYIVFSKPFADTDIFRGYDALTACGVFGTVDFSPLMSVLEKGTALPNDLAAFKPVYSAIGGVKHGSKAGAALNAHLTELFTAALKASASADVETAKALAAREPAAE